VNRLLTSGGTGRHPGPHPGDSCARSDRLPVGRRRERQRGRGTAATSMT